MDLSRRLIGASAVLSSEHEVIDVDLSGLIRRLLLFDKYVLVSVRLQEFRFLVKHFGYEGLRDLLSAKFIDIRCECVQLMQTAQSGMMGDPVLPLFTYRFHWVDTHDRRQYIRKCLEGLDGTPGLLRKEVSKLKKAVAGAIKPLPEDLRPQLFPAFQHELLNNLSLVKAAVGMIIHEQIGLTNVPFTLTVHQESSDTFRVETNLSHCVNIGELQAHKIVERGMMGISGLTQTLGEMKAYSAISGFRDEELPLFRQKLDFLADTVSSESKERSFRRVIDLAGLPDFSTDEGVINVETLLKTRGSSEAREFRDWLGGIEQASDEEIADQVGGLRAKAGLKVSSQAGRAMRFLLTTGIGSIPGGAVSAIALSAIDQFVVDKVLPRSGIAAFVNELYPSIFESKK